MNEAPTHKSTSAPPGDPDTYLPPVSATASTAPRLGTPSQLNSENWPDLKRLLVTLEQATAISGLGSVKSVIKGLVELTGLYEDAAQGRNEYNDLRVQLESIFDELSHHISSSPAVTTSVNNICSSIQKEIQFVKTPELQSRSKKRKREELEDDAYLVLECYRRIQGHLQRLTRNANMSTWKIVDQLVTDNRLRNLVPSLWACYNSERALGLERRSCTKGTRTNVLEQMYRWATAPNTGNIYWMSGMAGTGKTTIAYSLCEWLDAEPNRMLCASYFCSRSLPECRDVGRIIPAIAYQLARYSTPFRYALSQAMEKDPDAYSRLPHLQFDALLVQPLSDTIVQEALPTTMVAVIDALDECDDFKSTKLILDVLLAKSRNLPIKFFVSSRPEPVIRDQMEQNAVWVDARVVLHELDTGEVQNDIRTYLRAELTPIQPSDSEIQQLAIRAGVLFIYAATVVRYVGADNFKRNPRARLTKVLDTSTHRGKVQTREIDQLYGVILDAATSDIDLEQAERDDIKLILHTAVCVREPLTVSTLNGLLKLGDVDRVLVALRPLWSVLHVREPAMNVMILHASFPDFLFDSTRSGAWYCDAKAHHQLLAQRCFECIRDTEPQFNICRLESSYILDDQVPDLNGRVQKFISTELKYSCQYWSSHLEATEVNAVPDLAPMVSQFLTTHLLLWMEVRNLTKTLPATLLELTTAKRWATRHGIASGTNDLLTDAWRFASTFISSPVSLSTPHLYISMLPFLSSCSRVRKHYFHRFEGMLSIEGTAMVRRKDAQLAQWKLEFVAQCVAYSPDGTRIAVGGKTIAYPRHGRLYLLDAFTGVVLFDLSEDGEAKIPSVAFSGDGTHLVSGRTDGYISIWDASNGQLALRPFKAHDYDVRFVLYSRDGSYIVSTSPSDKTIRTWDALTGKPAPVPIIGCSEEVTCIATCSDDKFLVSGSGNGTIRVWGMQSGQLTLDPWPLTGHVVSAVAFSPDDSYIVSGSLDGTITVRDFKTGQMVYSPIKDPSGCVLSISISPDGASIASNFNGVRIWDAASGRLVSQLGPFFQETYEDRFERAIYSPDGTRIIYIWNRAIRLLDAQAGATGSNLLPGHADYIISIDISPNGRHLVSGSYEGTLCVWDLVEGELLLGPLQGHSRQVIMVRFSTDGSRVVSCSWDFTIRQWDAQSGAAYGAPIETPRYGHTYDLVVSAAYSPDNTQIVILYESGNLSVLNSRTGQLQVDLKSAVARRQFGSSGTHTCFSPDGTTVVAGYNDGSIDVWDVQSGQMVLKHDSDSNDYSVASFALSPNGSYYSQGFTDGKIILGSIYSGEHDPSGFQAHTDCVNSIWFSPDGSRLVSGSSDHAVHVWDVKSERSVLGPLRGHTSRVTSVIFSPDGKYVISASGDITIRVWDVQTNDALRKSRDTEYADWVLNKDGWVVSGESRRLVWVPADLRNALMSPRNTLILCRDDYVRLSFTGTRMGEGWADCWRNS